MKPRFRVRALPLVLLLLGVGDASAVSERKACLSTCREEIRACAKAGGGKRRCRRTFVRGCLEQDLAPCLVFETAARPRGGGLVAPTSLGASTLEPMAIVLVWDDPNQDETGYAIERSLSAESGFTEIRRIAANATSYLDTDVAGATTYFYRVRAYVTKGKRPSYSPYSTVASATTPDARVGSTTTSTSTSSTSTTTSSSTTSTTLAGNGNPVASAGPDRSGQVGQSLSFDGTASFDPDGAIVAHWWDWNDGSGWGMGALASHAYQVAGTYTVTLWVQDDGGIL